jgi:microcystin-dependent protein
MSDPYVGEIRLFGGGFAPVGWEICSGQLLQIAEHDILFDLIGTTYGGDGQNTFAVPDLRGRVPVGQGHGPSGTPYAIGAAGGAEQVTLTAQQLPPHTHPLSASTAGGSVDSPEGAFLATNPDVTMFINDTPTRALPANLVGPAGGSQPHANAMPTTAINYIISVSGLYPSPA